MPSVTPTIIRSSRSSISIHITPKGEVVVKAPKFLPKFMIQQFINSRQEWIDKHTKHLATKQPKKKQYNEGEEFLYLGEKHVLQLVDTTAIVAKEGILHFPKALLFRIEKELHDWYMREAREVIVRRLEHHAKQMDAEYKSILFSDTQSKWGTCWPDNSLQFNWRLVMAPLMVLDYVVIHELAHTKEKNHSDAFWRIVSKYTPAWKQHRKWLHNNAHLLMV